MTGAPAISTEAILWHGGEAQAARDGFAAPRRRRPRRADQIPGVALMRIHLAGVAAARARCPRVATPALANDEGDGHRHRRHRRLHPAGLCGLPRRRPASWSTAEQALCAAPSQQALDAARQSFGETVDAWSAIEIIRFGPVTEENRLERMLFWPDRKGTGLKQVQAALAAKDATATDAGSLASKSVAMQGLGALEFVLFGTGAGGTGRRRARPIAAPMARRSPAISTPSPASSTTAWADAGRLCRAVGQSRPRQSALPRRHRGGDRTDGRLRHRPRTGPRRAARRLSRRDAGRRQAEAGAVLALAARRVDALAANLAGMKALFEASGSARRCREEARWIAEFGAVRVRQCGECRGRAANGPDRRGAGRSGTARQARLSRPRHLQPVGACSAPGCRANSA